MSKSVDIGDGGELLIQDYSTRGPVLSFTNESCEYLNEAVIPTRKLPDVIAALQAEYDRRTKKKKEPKKKEPTCSLCDDIGWVQGAPAMVPCPCRRT